ncbi:MAG: hypothetical protein Phog2KO_19690 [Phototrophicaceae bacterium]
MKRHYWALFIITIIGLLFRVGLLVFINNPGLNDQNHYYNLGSRLLNGEGFTIDYIWHYSSVPDDIVHPIDHWMPLAGVTVTAGMAIAGENPQASLIFFIVAGSLLPLLVFVATKQYDVSDELALIASSFALFIPDFVWNSLRTDTTILNMVFITGSIIALTHAIKNSRWWGYVICGLLGGIAYITRNDSIIILPMAFVTALTYLIWGKDLINRKNLWQVMLVPIAFLITISPWLLRNYETIGMLGSPETSRMFFMIDARQHYAYNIPITLEAMLEQQTMRQLIEKRLFEFAAAIKQMIISLDGILAVLIPLGLLSLLSKRHRANLLTLSPALIWLLGILVAYPLLLPYKSQSGSFEKAYLTIIPMLLPLAAIAIEQVFVKGRWRYLAVSIIIVLMGLNSFEFVRQETNLADSIYARFEILTTQLETLPDVTGDDEIRLMSQDPFPLSYFGYSSVMIPLTSNLDDVLEIATRYDIDYLQMPAGRPLLDAIFMGDVQDERFVWVEDVVENGRIIFKLYEIRPDASDSNAN